MNEATPLCSDDGPWAHRAALVHIRQELQAPISAIIGYTEMLLDEASVCDCGDQALPDLERIRRAAHELLELSEQLLDPDRLEALEPGHDMAAVESRIRHDLRNPLNAILGYAEMLLEEAEDGELPVIGPDLKQLLAEAGRLQESLESVVKLTHGDERIPTGGDTHAMAAMAAHLARSIQPTTTTREHEPGRILVADDNDSNRELLVRWIGRLGHHVMAAKDGHEALALLQEQDFDVVLLDLIMPGLNGIETLGIIKQDPRLSGIPVIMISGLREMDGIVHCIEAGAEDYLPKPINMTLLRARLGSSLQRKQLRDRERLHLRELEREKRRSEDLLLNILPTAIVPRVHANEELIADYYDAVTVLFTDLVRFTDLAAKTEVNELVERLNRLYSDFDALAQRYGVEKIKTNGDSYMAAAGLPEPRPDHAEAAAALALEMLRSVERINEGMKHPFRVRIGLHSGPVMAGVIGSHKFAYDIWGDTVNTASRMESYSEPGRIHVSPTTARLLPSRFHCVSRGVRQIRGKGEMETFYLASPAISRIAAH